MRKLTIHRPDRQPPSKAIDAGPYVTVALENHGVAIHALSSPDGTVSYASYDEMDAFVAEYQRLRKATA